MCIRDRYLTADNDEPILMVLRAKLAEMMCRVNPELYRPFLAYSKKGVPMLYVRLSKALYGMLRAALLFCKKLRRQLEDLGFEVNPYDPCVANKVIKGNQCTICWHVDDLKISHVDSKVVDQVCKKLSDLSLPCSKLGYAHVPSWTCYGTARRFGLFQKGRRHHEAEHHYAKLGQQCKSVGNPVISVVGQNISHRTYYLPY